MRASCPKCGFEVPTHYKSWKMKTWKGDLLTAYMFACPSCGRRFRLVVKGDDGDTP